MPDPSDKSEPAPLPPPPPSSEPSGTVSEQPELFQPSERAPAPPQPAQTTPDPSKSPLHEQSEPTHPASPPSQPDDVVPEISKPSEQSQPSEPIPPPPQPAHPALEPSKSPSPKQSEPVPPPVPSTQPDDMISEPSKPSEPVPAPDQPVDTTPEPSEASPPPPSSPRPKTVMTRPTSFSRQHVRVDLIFNAISGTRDPEADLALLRTSLSKSFSRVVVWPTTADVPADDLTRSAIADGATVLVACGGDGTVAAVAAALRGVLPSEGPAPTPVLGVVPRGTANALCAALDIPHDVRRAAQMVAAGPLRRIDFPAVTHSHDRSPASMLLLCGVGLEADVVERADRGMKRALGTVAYALAGIASTWRQQNFRADIKLYDVEDALMFAGGAVRAPEVHLENMQLKGVTVANAAPATSVLAQGIGRVLPDDGLLEVVCVSSNSPLGLIRIMLSMLKSALMRTRERRGTVYGLRARKVEITCDPPQQMVIDGESVGETPITIEMKEDVPQLEVIAPKASAVNRRRRRFSRSLRRLWRNIRGVALLAATVALMKRSRKQIASST